MRCHHRLCVPTVAVLLFLAALPMPAWGQDIGVSVGGTVLQENLPEPWDMVGLHGTWTVDFCYDPSVADTDPAPNVGVYPGAITSAIVTIGGIAVAADLGGSNQVRVVHQTGLLIPIDSVLFEFELTNGVVVNLSLFEIGQAFSPPGILDGDHMPDCADLAEFDPGNLTLETPGGLLFLLFPAELLDCGTCDAPECYLVLGDAPGVSGTFTVFGHSFETQVRTAGSWWPVWLDEGPEIVIWDPPAPMRAATLGLTTGGLSPGGLASGGLGSVDLTAVAPWTFCAQVVMWNPSVFPANPEQSSHGLAVTVLPDGRVFTAPYGPSDGGLEIWAETHWNAQGQKVLRLPFSIPGF